MENDNSGFFLYVGGIWDYGIRSLFLEEQC